MEFQSALGLGVALLLLYIGHLINNYRDRSVDIWVVLVIYLTWVLTFSVVILLPVDIALSQVQGENDAKHTLRTIWTCFYWLLYILTWGILPVLNEFLKRGGTDPSQRFSQSLSSVYSYYLKLLVPILAMMLYLDQKYERNYLRNLVPVFQSVAHCYGISLIILLMGYAMVAIPRSFWRGGDHELMMNYFYFQLVNIDDDRQQAHFNFGAMIKHLHMLRAALNDHAQYLPLGHTLGTIIQLEIPQKLYQSVVRNMNEYDAKYVKQELPELQSVSVASLEQLHRECKYLKANARRAEWLYEMHLQKSFELQDIIKSMGKDRVCSKFRKERVYWQCIGGWVDLIEYWWLVRIKPVVKRLFVVVFLLVSLIIVLGEVGIFLDYKLQVRSLLVFPGNEVLTGVLVTIPMVVLIFIVTYGLFRLRINGLFGLYPNGQTDGESLIFAAINFSRVSYPLSYNYLQVLDLENTQFNRLFGSTNIVPIFGDSVTYFFPALLLIFIVLNYLDIFSKLLQCLGLEQFQFTRAFDDDKIHEGRVLLKKGTSCPMEVSPQIETQALLRRPGPEQSTEGRLQGTLQNTIFWGRRPVLRRGRLQKHVPVPMIASLEGGELGGEVMAEGRSGG